MALFIIFAALMPAAAPGAAPVADESTTGIIRPWDTFYSVVFLPSGKCYAVGAEGALLTSTDAGKSWQRQKEIAERGDLSWSDLYSIRFASAGQTGWISGEGGLILKTTDGGESWHTQNSGTTENLFRIAVVDPQTAYASGTNGELLGTTDGGEHWQPQTFKGGLTFFDIAFTDAHNGWAVGEFETIIHTSDGGKTWTAQRGGTRSNYKLPALFAVRFIDSQHGWAGGQGGTLLNTADGGKTWRTVSTPSDASMYGLNADTSGAPPTELWAAGDDGTVLRVALGVGSAPSEKRATFSSLSDITFRGQNGVAAGLGGTILHTSDGGAHWQVVTGK